jgi:hypothetical protein
MAITSGVYPQIIEVSDTVGSVGANTTVTATVTIAAQVPTTAIPIVTTRSAMQDGLSIGHAWISASSSSGATLSYKVINATGGALTPTDDPIALKVIIL